MPKRRKSAKKMAAGRAAAATRQRDEHGKFVKSIAAENVPETTQNTPHIAVEPRKIPEYAARYASDDSSSGTNTPQKRDNGAAYRPRSARSVALRMRLGEEV
jgi:hypothetical protein